ncbi:MAG TPA: hypothetical protein VMT32_11125 [Bryobacteraceae bacterium]|nr:hypothetical protein [Bryobacteraceae bacterium]
MPEPEPLGWRRFSFGGRLNGLPFNVLNNKDVNLTPANSTASYAYHTTNSYLQIEFGPSLEFRVTRSFALSAEFLYHRLSYNMTDTITADGNVTTVSEQTSARLWDAPVMVRWRGLAETGFLSHLYFAGGGELRNASHIRTNNLTTLPDGATSSDNIATVPSKRDLMGAVVGVGMRFVDDFGIKLTPEMRFTRWMGETFDNESTRSRRDELVIGIALTF